MNNINRELNAYKREERKKNIGQYLIDFPNKSIRNIAKDFRMSKSQIHRDLHDLRFIDDDVYVQCINILNKHKETNYIQTKIRR